MLVWVLSETNANTGLTVQNWLGEMAVRENGEAGWPSPLPHCKSVPNEKERKVLSAVLRKLWQGHQEFSSWSHPSEELCALQEWAYLSIHLQSVPGHWKRGLSPSTVMHVRPSSWGLVNSPPCSWRSVVHIPMVSTPHLGKWRELSRFHNGLWN